MNLPKVNCCYVPAFRSIAPCGRGLCRGIAACLILTYFGSASANAQLFGSRSVGSPINSPAGRGGGGGLSAAGSASGLLEGSERFVRGNRSRRDFVGSDRNEQSGFVGAGQAIGVGRVLSATEGLRIEATDANRINRPLPPQAGRGIYYPRLEIAFDRPVDVTRRTDVDLSGRLQERVANVAGDDVLLLMEGRTAILRGTVGSQHVADLTGLILSFEPGIDHVQNDLEIR